MSVWSHTKKTVKYVAWGMPTAIFGLPMLRASTRQLRDVYRSLTWPVCPNCRKGTLLRADPKPKDTKDPSATETTSETTWHCRACQSVFAAPAEAKAANEFFSAIRRTAAMEQMAQFAHSSRDALIRGHRIRSRWYYGMAVAFLLGFLANIALGTGVMSLLNWLTLAAVMAIFGLKAAYRCWQVTHGVVFEPGAFRRWFWQGRWFV